MFDETKIYAMYNFYYKLRKITKPNLKTAFLYVFFFWNLLVPFSFYVKLIYHYQKELCVLAVAVLAVLHTVASMY